MPNLMFLLRAALSLVYLPPTESANWAQLAGERAQTVVKPYIPLQGSFTHRPMWSRRWGHATAVLNQTSMYRNDLSVEQNSERAMTLIPKLIVLGGDDYGEDLSGGLRNDVWYSELSSRSTSTWSTNKRHFHSPHTNDAVVSNMKWQETNEGKEAPLFWPEYHEKHGIPMTFDDWISCQEYFGDARHDSCHNPEAVEHGFVSDNMWSPRRGHATATLNGALFVIGGRSREHVRVNDGRLFGEVMGARKEWSKEHLSVRESTILKNDVWVSHDGGASWSLVTPGCKDQQEDILARTEVWSMKTSVNRFAGTASSTCQDSSDCYGAAVCTSINDSANKVCTCSMFGAREHHSLSVQHRFVTKDDGTVHSEDYLYLVGGFTHIRQEVCGNRACGSRGSYRVALDDAWVSNDGANWIQLRPATIDENDYQGRGAHSTVLTHANLFRQQKYNRLWIFGGEHIHQNSGQSKYLNDIWHVDLQTEPCCASLNTCGSNIYPLTKSDIGRCLPSMLEWKSSERNAAWNERSGHVTIYEPPSSLNAFNDYIYLVGGKNSSSFHSDVWSLDVLSGEPWLLDFSKPSSSVENHDSTSMANKFRIPNAVKANTYQFYYDMHSSLRDLMRLSLPITKMMTDMIFEEPLAIPIIRSNDITVLENAGLSTFSDLVHASQRTILRLRGFDFPGRERSVVEDICYIKALVEAFEQKCLVSKNKDVTYHCDVNVDSEDCMNWDGCKSIRGYNYINVHGIGNVPVPGNTPEPALDLQNMFCKQTPGERYLAAGLFTGGKVLLLGGQASSANNLKRDVWYRDSKPPLATIKVKPKSRTSQSQFSFECDEDGALQFEYKIFDLIERLDVTPWQTSIKEDSVDIAWLDTKKGGPGSGWYTLYVRAVDPSGTRDVSYSTSTNSYSWFYLQPLPWGKITGIIIFSAILIAVAVIEYRRRERKAALERYAERKRRRRFKLNTMTNEGEEDWKDFYHKQAISTKQINEVNNDGTTTSDLRVDMSSEQRHRRRQRRKQREEILLNTSNESEDDNDDINAEVRRNRRRLKPKIR